MEANGTMVRAAKRYKGQYIKMKNDYDNSRRISKEVKSSVSR